MEGRGDEGRKEREQEKGTAGRAVVIMLMSRLC